MISLLLKFFKILSSEDSPMQIALAIWFAFLLTFLNLTNFLAWLIFLIVCLVRVNLSAFILFYGLFTLMSPLYIAWADAWGFAILTHSALSEFWVTIMNSSFGVYAHLNHTVVTGGLLVAMLSLIPSLLLLPYLVKKYRSKLLPLIERSKVVQALRATSIYQRYLELR